MRTALAVTALTFGSAAWLLSAEPSEQLTGKVVAIADGDTLTLLVGNVQHRVRLNAIDAPETGQDHSAKARQFLADRVQGRAVRVDVAGRDRYGRLLGTVWVGTENVNERLLSEGWAWHYKEYDQTPRLAELEAAARAGKRGLWEHPAPVPPWEYRALQKRAAAERANPIPREQQQYWLNTSTDVRHNSTCPHFQNTARGRLCGPTEGKACGQCGG